jgi:hypothetical protein
LGLGTSDEGDTAADKDNRGKRRQWSSYLARVPG